MEEIIKKVRARIAEKEKEQKLIKPQRKTVHFTGTRTIDSDKACYKVESNKEELRAMYAAYNLLRGKNFEITEKNAKPIDVHEYFERYGMALRSIYQGKHPLVLYLDEINRFLEEYGYSLPYTEDVWYGNKFKIFDLDNYEKIIRIGE